MIKEPEKAPGQEQPQRLNGPADPNLRRPPMAGGPRKAAPTPPPMAMSSPRKKGMTPLKAFFWASGITGTSTGLGFLLF